MKHKTSFQMSLIYIIFKPSPNSSLTVSSNIFKGGFINYTSECICIFNAIRSSMYYSHSLALSMLNINNKYDMIWIFRLVIQIPRISSSLSSFLFQCHPLFSNLHKLKDVFERTSELLRYTYRARFQNQNNS